MCDRCDLLIELYGRIDNPTLRDYWVRNEIFVMLHDGKEYCEGRDKEIVDPKWDKNDSRYMIIYG